MAQPTATRNGRGAANVSSEDIHYLQAAADVTHSASAQLHLVILSGLPLHHLVRGNCVRSSRNNRVNITYCLLIPDIFEGGSARAAWLLVLDGSRLSIPGVESRLVLLGREPGEETAAEHLEFQNDRLEEWRGRSLKGTEENDDEGK